AARSMRSPSTTSASRRRSCPRPAPSNWSTAWMSMNSRASIACSCWSITCGICNVRRLAFPPWSSINSSDSSKTSGSASAPYGGFFEYDQKKERLEEVGRELEDPTVWSNQERAQELGRERARLSSDVGEIDRTSKGIEDAAELLELAESEGDEAAARDIEGDAGRLEGMVRHLELKRMFRGEMDSHSAFLDI